MPELRKDPIVGRWVIIATERARRPGNIIDPSEIVREQTQLACPFCEHQEKAVAPEIFAFRGNPQPNGPGWQVRVVPSQNPFLQYENYCQRRGHGLYDVMNAYGTHETVIETPQHIENMADLDLGQIELVVKSYALRCRELSRNPELKFIMAFKNYSRAIPLHFAHTRSQIVATPINPMRAKDKLKGARHYYQYHERCIYCDLIVQELDAKKRIVLETDHFVVITPFASRFPFETWIIPKKHACDFHKGIEGYEGDLARALKSILQKVKIGLRDPEYNFVIHSAPIRKDNGRQWLTIEDDYHWHMEVMPVLTRVAGFEKGTGFYICVIPPEQTAEYLREVKV